jgi:hypothetical protein
MLAPWIDADALVEGLCKVENQISALFRDVSPKEAPTLEHRHPLFQSLSPLKIL